MPYTVNMFGNPHSRTHQYGWETEKVRVALFVAVAFAFF